MSDPFLLSILLEIGSNALMVADWAQTLNLVQKIESRTGDWYERCRFLPRHPTRGQVNTYFVSLFALKFALNRAFPQHRNKINGYFFITWGVTVAENHRIGLRVTF